MDAYDGGAGPPREAGAPRGQREPAEERRGRDDLSGVRTEAAPSDGLSDVRAEVAGEDGTTGSEPRSGVAALSPRYQVAAALALAVVAVAVCVHIGMVFLHVAPSNTVTKAHGEAIDAYVYPEFEQNWKLFAPNPLQQNIAVQVRADVRTADGTARTTGWFDLSAQDGRSIDGNLVPSHTQQNELRRAWDFYVGSHDSDDRSAGPRSTLAETYLRNIVVLRLERGEAAGRGGTIERVQVRSRTTNVPAPSWSTDEVSSKPVHRVLPWWPLASGDTGGGTR
ncbi:DUF5819 family protein [Streptomyces sp. NPDC003401]